MLAEQTVITNGEGFVDSDITAAVEKDVVTNRNAPIEPAGKVPHKVDRKP